MRVVSGNPWRLDDARNLRALSVVGRSGVPGHIEGNHAWLEIATLRAAGPQDDGWLAGFDAMISYATAKDWVQGDRVRAHVED